MPISHRHDNRNPFEWDQMKCVSAEVKVSQSSRVESTRAHMGSCVRACRWVRAHTFVFGPPTRLLARSRTIPNRLACTASQCSTASAHSFGTLLTRIGVETRYIRSSVSHFHPSLLVLFWFVCFFLFVLFLFLCFFVCYFFVYLFLSFLNRRNTCK